MSFASDVRGEIAREPCAHDCCARSEVAAALLASGGISFRGPHRYALSLTAAEGAVARRYFAMLKQHFGITAQIRTLLVDALGGRTRYQLVVAEADAPALLEALGLLDPAALFGVRQAPEASAVRYACCRKAFLRGAFLLCGAVNKPEGQYHLEFAAPTEEFADFLSEQVQYFEFSAKKTCRKAKYVVYLKRAEEIAGVLALMGANAAVLQMENVRVAKDMRNRVNRQLNCDVSNIGRIMNAAESQVRDILYLDEQVGLDKLPKPLRDAARARLENPEMSLGALGEAMSPPLGKSGVNARLRKLAQLANKLRAGEDTEL